MVLSEANPVSASSAPSFFSSAGSTFLNQRRGSKSARFVHDLFDGSPDALEILLIESTAREIAFGELQTLKGHVVEVAHKRLILKAAIGCSDWLCLFIIIRNY